MDSEKHVAKLMIINYDEIIKFIMQIFNMLKPYVQYCRAADKILRK